MAPRSTHAQAPLRPLAPRRASHPRACKITKQQTRLSPLRRRQPRSHGEDLLDDDYVDELSLGYFEDDDSRDESMEQQEEVDMIQEDDKRALDKENEKDAVDGENAAMDEDFKGEVRVVSKIKGDPFQGSEEEDARGVTSEEEPAQQIAIPEQHAPMDVNEKKLEAGAVTRPTNITVDGARNLKVGFVAPEQQTITRLEYDTFLEKHLKVCVENEMLRAALEKKQARSEISYYNISFCSVM